MKQIHVQVAEEFGSNARSVLGEINDIQLRAAVSFLMSANNVHILGIGHSGFFGKVLSMKLNHVGLSAYTVYNETNPPIRSGDVFVAISQSGETRTIISLVEEARSVGAKVLGITANEHSKIGQMSDVCLRVGKRAKDMEFPAMSILGNGKFENMNGALFGASIYALFYAIVIMIMQERGETVESVDARHANLQ
ncbi:MAG: SIS domain-containing protein [Lentisphaerae bacterium]|nr:SIS domain-containing protein [Lentisphaerota bacterium]